MFVFVCASPPRLSVGTGRCRRSAYWSNIQLTRGELPTLDAAIKITSEKGNANTLPHLGFGARGVRKRRGKEVKGRDEPKKTSGGHCDKDLQLRTAIGRTKEAQAQNKLSRSVKQTKLEQSRATP